MILSIMNQYNETLINASVNLLDPCYLFLVNLISRFLHRIASILAAYLIPSPFPRYTHRQDEHSKMAVCNIQ